MQSHETALDLTCCSEGGCCLALGVRTFRKIGPALLIDSMVTIFNSIKKYGPELALDRVIRSSIMPSLEGLERNEIRPNGLDGLLPLRPGSSSDPASSHLGPDPARAECEVFPESSASLP